MTKTVLITGSSSGFGHLTAKKFQQQGWNVIATMRAPEKDHELSKLDNVLVTKLDITDSTTMDDAIEKGIERFGSIDVLVNNAGISVDGMFEQVQEDNMRKIYEVNIIGPMLLTQKLLPHMRQRKSGVIVNIASMAAYFGAPTLSLYASSKFAMKGFTESLSLECEDFNIKVKGIYPGTYLSTKFFQNTNRRDTRNGDSQLRVQYRNLINRIAALVKDSRSSNKNEPSDPQEVADKIFECVTTKTPLHNIIGKDAEDTYQMRNNTTDNEFYENMRAYVQNA